MLTNQSIDPNAEKPPFILWRPFIALWHWLVPPTQAHRDRQTGISRYAGAIVLTVVCVTAVAFAIIYAKPIQDAYQQWRAETLVEEARSLVDQGEVYQAVVKAQEAYQIAPEHIEAIRLNGEFLSRMGRSEAIYFLEKLQTLGAATPADLQLLVRSYQKADRGGEAEELLEEIVSSNPANESTLRLAQDVLGEDIYMSNMLPKLKAYAEENPDDERNMKRLAQLQVESNIPSEVSAGVRTLWQLAESDSQTGLEALELLTRFPNLPPEDDRRLIQRLSTHPRATTSHGVLALRRQLAMFPEKRQQIFLEGVARYRDREREELLPLVRWFVEEKEYQRVLTMLSKDDVVTYQPLLENYLTCLTMLQRFDDLEELIDDPRVDMLLTPATSTFFQMHLGYVTRKPAEEMRKLMEKSLMLAEQEARGGLLLAIGRYGMDRGITDIAEQAFLSASKSSDGRTRVLGLQGFMKASRINGNSEGYLQAIHDAVRIWPDNQDYQEQFLYINLLVGRDVELSMYQTERLLKRRSDDAHLKLLMALGWWRMSDVDTAATFLRGIDIKDLNFGQRAIVAAIARSAGFAADGQSVLNTLPSDATMLPEELVFFRSASL